MEMNGKSRVPIPHVAIAVEDRSAIGEARRIAGQLAERAGLSGDEEGRAALIATELAANLLQHAHDGEILLGMLPADFGQGIEIYSIDRGPGMSELQCCIADGYSSRGTRGCGLGAIQRMSTTFEIHTRCPSGTIVAARVFSRSRTPQARPNFAVISRPIPGEFECGDSWGVRRGDDKIWVMVVDGLGHGSLAAAAAAQAVRVFKQTSFDSPEQYLEAANDALRPTRGAAAALAEVSFKTNQLCYAGTGNIASRILGVDGGSQSLVSQNGTLGVGRPRFQQFQYTWRDQDLLLMHSDGISGRWRLDFYPSLPAADPGLVVATVYRDANRSRDDATVLAARLDRLGWRDR